jgi:peroxiredoxin
METTPICDFGWKAVDFSLRGIDGHTYSLKDVAQPNGTLIMFICNHCPYVKAIADRLVREAHALEELSVGVIAIMSNDTVTYPADSFENMVTFAKQHSFPFPYVIDDTQEVARAYDAVCTPDFFGFNNAMELQYRGRLDETGRNPPRPDSRRELYEAMSQIAETGQGPREQTPSIGCSIKWCKAA